ncbi:MAG: DUF4982 domain-containing protein [Christensenellaceae bacterium]|nr:DUF4982 domain-containing protein [Christensenellaceae bacterium]
MSLNTDWRFHLGDEPGADLMGWDDRAWRQVTLPHDWSVEHPFDRSNASGTGYLPGGTAWYRKHFTLPESAAGQRVRITFGGVYKHARVWVNSNYLGERAYGYSTFTYDVSDFVRPGENVISVRVEHSEVADSRWFTGSGIYRDVTLEVTGRHGFAVDGVFVTTKAIEEDGTALLTVRYQTEGGHGAAFLLMDREGRVCGMEQAQGESGEVEIVVPGARLWSPDSPTLYILKCCAMLDRVGVDEIEIPVGIRTFRFDGDKGFFLNGENMKLKGVCVHHDAGALGAAVPKTVWARRLRKLKAAGCNALRTAHNPPDPALLDLCDELGFLVMDEAFDEWEGVKNKWWQGHNVYPPKRFGYGEDFPQWYRADLEGMVKRDRNHPCIVLWSIGNEIDYPNDPYVTPLFKEVLGNNDHNKPQAERLYDARKPDAGRLAVLARELTEIVHQVDDTRPVTSAVSFPELSNRTGFSDALDVVGYNYKEQFYDEDHAAYPGRVIYGSENSHHPRAWQSVAERDFICGQFLWTGVDFLGECRGWPVRISQAGMLNLAGFEKPLYDQRRAMWTTEPFARISVAPNANVWHARHVWSGEPGQELTVCVATNAPEAELFLNGMSLGKQPAGLENGYRAVWQVPYAPGTLKAVVLGAQDTLETAGKPAAITLTPDKTDLIFDGQDVAQVEVTLRDAEGRTAIANEEPVYYQVTGDAVILGIENGAPDDLTPYAAPYRATLDGRAIVYLRAGTLPGAVTLHAYTKTGLRASCTLTESLKGR